MLELNRLDRTREILYESSVVLGAIARHEREAIESRRHEEAEAMHRLAVGVTRSAMSLTADRVTEEEVYIEAA